MNLRTLQVGPVVRLLLPGTCASINAVSQFSQHTTCRKAEQKHCLTPKSHTLYLHRRQHASEITPKNVLNLHERQIFKDIYPPASIDLPNKLTKKQCFYCGFDPTADSLHIGNLLSIMALIHCQRAGHNVIAVIGTATARAGDPSEHKKDRKLLDNAQIHSNAKKISKRISEIVDYHDKHLYDTRGQKKLPEFKILENHKWYENINSIDFISRVFRHFRMGPMMDKRYIKDRLDGPNGLILAEFLYQALQAYDWLYLYEKHNCSFQIGGMDQLGNINAGQQLIRKLHEGEVYGLLTPLVTTPRGEKLGKTAGNSVWLDPEKTSPFEFYQYFFRQPDSAVDKLLRYFTFIDLKTIKDIVAQHKKNPARRNAQHILATQVCKIVHGKSGLESAERCTQALYSGGIEDLEVLSNDEIDVTFAGMKVFNLTLEPHTTMYDVCKAAEALPAGGKTGENVIKDGGVKLNGQVVNSPHQLLLNGVHVLKNDLTLLTVGKNKHYVIRWSLPRIEHDQDDAKRPA